ncbi:MAG TPA: NADH-quinone oxidoreductase subunit H [Terriglobales bacterium]|nr:NADH-quinone oxidoreductase subunit H [Terriglobales bacterium]
MRLALTIVQALLLIALAPLLRGIIARLKARIQNRRGASILRPYSDLLKLFRKEDLQPATASPLFRLAPVVVFACSVAAAAFVPVLYAGALAGGSGDFILLVYLFALARFFLILGAADGGSAFGGMGASREALVSTLAEAPLLLGLAALAIVARSASVEGIVQWTLTQDFFQLSAVHALAFSALALVAIAETGRIPVDNPTTHLELTMIHEAMVLEYSGPSLAFIEWASAIKLSVISALLIAVFLPWGMATAWSAGALVLALLAFAGKVLAIAVTIAVVESSVAKLRMYMVPDFLGVASALAILAVVFTALMR